MSKWGRTQGAEEPDEEEASQASGHSPQPYLSMPATLPELKEREGGAFQESSPPQGYGGEPVQSNPLRMRDVRCQMSGALYCQPGCECSSRPNVKLA